MKTDTTINGRTPEEIRKGLECCSTHDYLCGKGCPYKAVCHDYVHHNDVIRDALAYIQQLERERDAAVADLKEHGMFCSLCMHEEKSIHEEPCVSCSKLSTANNHSNWQWRGVQEVE